ncbi:hypothetical protein RRG08_033443 [Elysia crispata]|uniref:Uncharacterized protein n=1 Tax=Elysia crispata TaxID=231223 RepID=A0AAE1AV47_9GAST|nr:hypothetical protein RRG08_033443 [Elysia crispata]
MTREVESNPAAVNGCGLAQVTHVLLAGRPRYTDCFRPSRLRHWPRLTHTRRPGPEATAAAPGVSSLGPGLSCLPPPPSPPRSTSPSLKSKKETRRSRGTSSGFT